MVKKIKVETVVNDNVYQSVAFPYIKSEKAEQIFSCKRQFEKMLDEDELIDIHLGSVIELYK